MDMPDLTQLKNDQFIRQTARCSYLTVMRYSYYANGFRFDSHLADFRFVFFL